MGFRSVSGTSGADRFEGWVPSKSVWLRHLMNWWYTSSTRRWGPVRRPRELPQTDCIRCWIESPQFRVGKSPLWFKQRGTFVPSRMVFIPEFWFGHPVCFARIEDFEESLLEILKEEKHGN